MKTRFSSLDIIAILPELKAKLCTGWRVNQVYDCDHKTFLFKLNKSIVKMKKDHDPLDVNEETANKMTFIIESGTRMHTTDYDWPRSHAPNHFATKLRKHIRNKRIEDLKQVGIDRLVDIQFGTHHAANHLLIELYDKGNMILTDHNYSIIHILRWRKPTDKSQPANYEKDSEIFKIGDVYPLDESRLAKDLEDINEKKIIDLLYSAQSIISSKQNFKKRNRVKHNTDDGTVEVNLKDLLNPFVIYGSSLLEDKLLTHVFHGDSRIKKTTIKIKKDKFGVIDTESVKMYAKLIKTALDDAQKVLDEVKLRDQSPGYLVQKKLISDSSQKIPDGEQQKSLKTNIDFFPILSCALRKIAQENNEYTYEEFESFDKAIDTYYSNLESQKLDSKAMVAEKEARKKLNNLKIAQEQRLNDLVKEQQDVEERARLIELNCDKVENALLIIRSLIANQFSWSEIWDTIKEAQSMNDPIASLITQVKFDRNEFTMKLSDPYDDNSQGEDQVSKTQKYKNVDIDISLSAFANARKFFVKRRTAVNKEKKAVEVSKKALKNVEKQTREKLKDMVVKTNITKTRKRYWFENFYWFLSSEGYLIVAGREAEQNDLLVKRYMKTNDIYVHADLHGAASVIVKNESSEPIPPKTLTEAGSMSVCYSSAWDSKIATTSWWVYPNQVSKTAPSGEYLGSGAFMIRGKKNYLPLSNLVLGYGFLFRLDEESIEKRKQQRLIREEALKTSSINSVVAESDSDDDEDENDIGKNNSCDEGSITDDNKSGDEPDAKESHRDNNPTSNNGDFDEDDDEDDSKTVEHRLIDTLTENPQPDDILLYSIPMCGPYSALQSFKFKVKVIPGANKRGKAAKTCLSLFLHDKRSTQREKDLLRALKDQDYARNVPNKVKISAGTNLRTINKRRPKKSEVRLPPK